MRKSVVFVAVVLCSAPFGQTASGQMFDVVSIRPAEQVTAASIASGKSAIGQKIEGQRVSYGYMSLRDLVTIAYEVTPFQITAPDWMAAQRYDISAVMPAGTTKEQIPAMLRAMLTERFSVKAHKETKEANIYALVEAKGGNKMKPALPPEPVVADKPAAAPAKGEQVISAGDQQIRINPSRAGAAGGGTLATISGGPTGATKISLVGGGTGLDATMRLEMERVTMEQLVQQLTPMVDLPVVDRTDLKGAFQIALELRLTDMLQMVQKMGMGSAMGLPPGGLPPGLGGAAPAPAAADPGGQSIFASVQQMGLRLDKQKGDVTSLIVDSANKTPTEN